ncbi:MAG: hypothetical protein KKD28_03170 [Chloroflexi bacterium]|nr:hypothetical protein [Chloroflexota bacterium]MBU1660454.1 hypothetical protein [Chloroflexota bacterium]
MEIGDWRLEIGDWRLEIRDWRLEIRDWRLEIGDQVFGYWFTYRDGASLLSDLVC